MRRFATLSLTSAFGLVVLSSGTWAQAVESYEAPGDVTTSDTTLVLLGGPTLLRQAAALVAMAEAAPSAAATYPDARIAAHEALAASLAYQSALNNYSDGYYESADSAARVAVQLAGFATSDAMRRPQAVPTVSEGSLAAAGPVVVEVPNPAPVVLITETRTELPSSYADLTPLPFGAVPAGPYAPALRDSLPFGATRVGRTPALVAP
jgi:hypothetical protein